MKPFIHENFLLQNNYARKLYFDYASEMPIYDYHNHLCPKDIADNRKFNNLTELWLSADHYKWRAMRSNGIDEKFITGDASDYEKFLKWAETVPQTLRNPLYHWTHMELKNYFGIDDRLLSAETAEGIYSECSKMLSSDDFSARALLMRMNVKVLCTTDDPTDSCEHHKFLQKDFPEITIVPTFRPDKIFAVANTENFNDYVDVLSAASGITISSYDDLLAAYDKRHLSFHEIGCRLSDHGLAEPYSNDFSLEEIRGIFKSLRGGNFCSQEDADRFKSALLYEFALMNYNRSWTMQLHIGPLRNNNSRMFSQIGGDCGCDSMDDRPLAIKLVKFLDRLNTDDRLPKIILYNLNSSFNDVFLAIAGSFQNSSIPGKIQHGPGWWFLDQKDGMENQMNTLSAYGLLSRFTGMVTDSRSLLSFTRHEYFRRILCNILGNDMSNGLIPEDITMIGQMVKNICYNNAFKYFDIPNVNS